MSTKDELNKMIKDLATLKDNNDNGILKDENGKTTSKINLVRKIRVKRSQIKRFQDTKGYQNVDVDSEVKKLIKQFNKQKSSKSSGSDTQAPRTMKQIPPAPSSPITKMLTPEQITQISGEEADRLRKEKEIIKKKFEEAARKENEKIKKEQEKKELEEWKKKKGEIEGLINNIKIDKFAHFTYEAILSQIENPSKEIHPQTWKDRKKMAQELEHEYNAYSERKKEKKKKEKKEQEEKEEKDKLKPLIDEVDNFISSTLNMNTYANFVEIKGIKDLEKEIQQKHDAIRSKLTSLNFKTYVKKERLMTQGKLRSGYTDFLKELNAKEKELQDKINLEKRLMAIQKQQEENARIQEAKKAAADKKAALKLAWIKKRNDKRKAIELKQQEEARKKKEQEDKQKRLMEHRQKIMGLRNKFKQSVTLLLGNTMVKGATAASGKEGLQKIKNERNSLLEEITKSEEEKKGNVFVEDLIIKHAEIRIRKNNIDEQTDSVDKQNLLSQYNKLLVDAQNHNTVTGRNKELFTLNRMQTQSAKETKRLLLLVPTNFINLIKRQINGLKTQIELEEKQRIANSIKKKEKEELQLINKFLQSEKSLHSPNIHNELYKSKTVVASAVRKWRRTKKNKKE